MIARTRRKRLLFISPVVPGDAGNGLAMRAGLFLEAYARHFDVDLAVVPVAAGHVTISDFASRRCARSVVIAPRIGTHFRLLSGIQDPQARCDAFRRYGQASLTAGITEPVVAELRSWIGTNDYAMVHVSRLYLAGLAAALREALGAARFVLDCDENDTATQQSIGRMHRRNGSVFRSEWALLEAEAFARLARQALAGFDVAFMASQGDAARLARDAGYDRFVVVPNVIAMPERRRAPSAGAGVRTVLFVGTLGYAPNDDAVHWFATRVWPRLFAGLPDRLRLVIAGTGPSARIQRLAGRYGIVVTGRVPEVASLYRSADLVIAPLRAGGGTRIKLLEAAAYGVPAVATRVGAEGLDLRPGCDILLADGLEPFAAACRTLLTHSWLAHRIGANARNRVQSRYDRRQWTARLADFALQMAEESYNAPSPIHNLGLTHVRSD